MMPRSSGRGEKEEYEATFALQLRSLGVPEPEREYQFAKAMGRRWRFDMAWPLIGQEGEGG